ncbi:Uncharacterised protein [uncultured archaeon]|nr:Uncharacterised protein [uncultured archaeon]
MDYSPINAQIPRSVRKGERPDWTAFRRAQEPHQEKFDEMRKDWKQLYNYSPFQSVRAEAGRCLDHSELRIFAHELIFPAFYLYGAVMGKYRSRSINNLARLTLNS